VTSTEKFIAGHATRHQNEGLLRTLEDAFRELGEVTGTPAGTHLPTGSPGWECAYRVVRESGMVFDLHPCRVEVTMQTGLFTTTVEPVGHAGITHVLNMLTSYAERWTYNPLLTVLPSCTPLPDDAYDNELRLDLDPTTGLVAVACDLQRGPHPGRWFTRGNSPRRPGRRLVWDYGNGGEAFFPPDASVPAELLPALVHQFYDLNGAGLPPCVDWQHAEPP
jgi:hypothetical protein